MSLSLLASRRALEKRRWRRCGCDWLDRGGRGRGSPGAREAARDLRGRYPRRWFRCPTWARPERGFRVPRPARARRRRRLRGRLVGRRCLGRGPGGRGVLGGGDALAGAGAGRLAACRDDGWRGEACASVSVEVDVSREMAGSGRGDRGSDRAEKAHPVFFFAARRDAAPERAVSGAARAPIYRTHLGALRACHPWACLCRVGPRAWRPGARAWAPGVGETGRGRSVARSAVGVRASRGGGLPATIGRVRLGRRPSETRARRSMRAHSRPSSSPPSWSPPRTFPLRGWVRGVRVGQRGCARRGARRRGHRRRSPPFGFPWSAKQITAVESAPAIGGLAMFRACDSLSIRAFVAASMSPPYFLSMATTSSSPWPVIEMSV